MSTVPVYQYYATTPVWRYLYSATRSDNFAFYAFAEPQGEDSGLPEPIVPIHQYYAIDKQGRWRYQYSADANVREGWKSEGPAFYALLPQLTGE